MEIDKTTSKNGQVWVTFKSNNGEYIGTLHIVSDKYLEEVKSSLKEECNR